MNKENIPKLSQAEWEIMKVCWQEKSITARNVYEAVLEKKSWEYRTVKTMLDRLVEKGYLRREKEGHICLYIPCVKQRDATNTAIESFISTVLENTFSPLFAYFAKDKKLSKEEIISLQKMIDEFEDKK